MVTTTTGLIRSIIEIQRETLEIYTYTPKSKPASGLHFLFDGMHRDVAGICSYLSAPITICLGTEDVEDLHLSRSSNSMRQGRNRLEQGRRFYKTGQQVARMNNFKFNWRLVEIAGVGHSSREMLTCENFAKLLPPSCSPAHNIKS